MSLNHQGTKPPSASGSPLLIADLVKLINKAPGPLFPRHIVMSPPTHAHFIFDPSISRAENAPLIEFSGIKVHCKSGQRTPCILIGDDKLAGAYLADYVTEEGLLSLVNHPEQK